MKNDLRLTTKLPAQYRRPNLTLGQLAHMSVAKNISSLLRQLYIVGSGYTHSELVGLISDLPSKISRSKDLSLTLTKIAKLSVNQNYTAPLFGSISSEFKINRKTFYKHNSEVVDLIIEILNSNRNPFLKLALIDLIRTNSSAYHVCNKIIGSANNQIYYFEVESNNKTFDTLIQNDNMLDMLRDDSYMSSILTKFKVLSASIEQADPELYRIASECITDILGADSTLSALQPYARFIKEWSKVDESYPKTETFESRYNLDCGCEHQPTQAKDEFIGEIIFLLYKLKAPQ